MDVQSEELLPMKALVAAVLERALQDLKLTSDLAAPARDWLEERGLRQAWSFEWCCAILNLDPDAVREQFSDDHLLHSS